MGEFSKAIIEEYRSAREEGNYAVQSGILISLLQSVMAGGVTEEVARDTVQAILQVHASS